MNSIDHAATFATVQAYIDDLNKDADGFALADADHFAEAYNIKTPVELENYLFLCSFIDVYKDATGIRPCGEWSREQVEAWLETTAKFNAWEVEQEEAEGDYEIQYADSEQRWQEFTTG